MTRDATKGRAVGFFALAALIGLVAIAFYSERSGSAPATQPTATTTSAPTDPVARVEVPTTRFTESIPTAPPRGGLVTAVAEDVSLSPKARLLAERFRCVCGCRDVLAVCTCKKSPGSRDMKRYLQRLVDEGRSPLDIESAMLSRYGQDALP